MWSLENTKFVTLGFVTVSIVVCGSVLAMEHAIPDSAIGAFGLALVTGLSTLFALIAKPKDKEETK